jgi:flagellin
LGSFANTDFAVGTNTVTGGTTAFAAVAAGELTINGKDIVLDAATSVADRGAALVDEINSAFADGTVKASFVNGKLNLTGTVDIVVAGTAAAGAGLTEGTTKFTAGKAETGFSAVNIATAEGADNAILAMDAALKAVNSARADLGAIQNRFESVVSNLSVNSENLSASRSRIQDADFAAETANLSRAQILQQAGTAMVAQANQLPQGVLSLLR